MKRNIDMLNGPLFNGILSFAVPVILTNLLQILFNTADLIVVGQFCGSLSVAAVSATNSLTMLIVNFFIGFPWVPVFPSPVLLARSKKMLFTALSTQQSPPPLSAVASCP